jgi:hypothetical protein
MIKSYDQFINEGENINKKNVLREYVISHIQEGVFQIKSDDFYKEIDVLPYKRELLDKLKILYRDLLSSLRENNTFDIYKAVTKAEALHYNYGEVIPKFTLENIPELETSLTDEQRQTLKNSERNFFLNSFSQLNKTIKTDIIQELTKHAELLACVIEALFYYLRTINKDDYYKGHDAREILDEYSDAIDAAIKEIRFSKEGPYDDYQSRSEINEDSDQAYWICEKDLHRFLIKGVLNIKELYANDNVGTPGLHLSILMINGSSMGDSFTYVPIGELGKRIEAFIKKYEKIKK